MQDITDGQVIAIDGKTLRRSYDKASSKSAIHMVSAWATANHISLGQVVVDAKSNEITAIPKLLQILEISGSLVTIDLTFRTSRGQYRANCFLSTRGSGRVVFGGDVQQLEDLAMQRSELGCQVLGSFGSGCR